MILNILLLGGFLGSGKTTILLQLAKYISDREEGDGTKIMIIENEIGEVGVDDKILKSQGLAVRELFAGCACCTSGGDLLSDIQSIKDQYDPKWIIIEATGVAYPRSIRESIWHRFKFEVKVLILADAARWTRLQRAMSGLIEAQIECADCVFINKSDLVDESALEVVTADIKAINPGAQVRRTNGTQPLDDEIWRSIIS